MTTEQQTSKIVQDFEFHDLGVDHAQYFQGAGVAYTTWDEVFVGVGDTAREAASDARESLGMGYVYLGQKTAERLDFALLNLDDTSSAHDDCELTDHSPACLASPDECDCHDECELQHYMALYVRYASEVPA